MLVLILSTFILSTPPKFIQADSQTLEFQTVGSSLDTEDDDVLFYQSTIFSGNQPQKHNDFHRSTININDGTFAECTAFGKTDSSSSGGALFVTESSVSCTGAQFSKCTAITGGAMVLFSSQLLITKVDSSNVNMFQNNKAYQYAGDIYSSGVDGDKDFVSWTYIKSVNFVSSSASQIGGSLVLQIQSEIYVEDCIFNGCKCGYTGGAVFISASHAQFYNSNFINNVCGTNAFQLTNGTEPIIGLNKVAAKHIERSPLKRTGGAIAFHANIEGDIPMDLTTQLCCFGSNVVENSNLVKGEIDVDFETAKDLGGFGADIYISGLVSYNSFSDTFKYESEEEFDKYSMAIAQLDKYIQSSVDSDTNETIEAHNQVLKPEYAFWRKVISTTGQCLQGAADTTVEPSQYEVSYFPSTAVIAKYSAMVPTPTTFIYQATPVTRLPAATTRSHKYPSKKTVTLTFGDTLSVMPTPIATASLSISPSRSVSASASPSPSIDRRVPTMSYTPSMSPTPTFKPTMSVSATPTPSLSVSVSRTPLPTPRRSPIQTPTASDAEYSYNQGDTVLEKQNYLPIFIGVGCGIFILIIAAALIWFFVFSSSRRSDSDSDSSVEMMEETVLNFPEQQESIITQDNPLWTTSVMGADDDPFRNDFEEVDDTLFFRVSRGAIE